MTEIKRELEMKEEFSNDRFRVAYRVIGSGDFPALKTAIESLNEKEGDFFVAILKELKECSKEAMAVDDRRRVAEQEMESSAIIQAYVHREEKIGWAMGFNGGGFVHDTDLRVVVFSFKKQCQKEIDRREIEAVPVEVVVCVKKAGDCHSGHRYLLLPARDIKR